MNWYKTAKILQFSSITFYPAGSDKMATPMDVGDIAYDLQRFILREMKPPGIRAYFNDISEDGLSFGQDRGFVNFYETPESGLTLPIVQQIVDAYNKAREGVVKLQVKRRDMSGIFKVPVVRAEVIENNTVNYPSVPEFNIANDNAYQLFLYLRDQGVPINPEDPAGSISVDAIKFVLSDKTPPSPEPYAGEMSPASVALRQELGGETAQWTDASSPITQRFPRYMESLKQIVDFIDKNNLPDRRILYN